MLNKKIEMNPNHKIGTATYFERPSSCRKPLPGNPFNPFILPFKMTIIFNSELKMVTQRLFQKATSTSNTIKPDTSFEIKILSLQLFISLKIKTSYGYSSMGCWTY